MRLSRLAFVLSAAAFGSAVVLPAFAANDPCKVLTAEKFGEIIGGAYRQGSIVFSLSIRSTDQTKLQALVAEVRRNLK